VAGSRKWGALPFCRLKKTCRVAKVAHAGVLVTLAVEREDGYLWSEPKLNRRITLVR
jgi:hypothetical protein